MTWIAANIADFHSFSETYISSYTDKIDCADLAIKSLLVFAAPRTLPVRLKYYRGGWHWLRFRPTAATLDRDVRTATVDLGALNVIDNTVPITISDAEPGDLIMSRWSNRLGHTRIIYSVTQQSGAAGSPPTYRVVWYQGNLPPVVPERREEIFSQISGVYGNSPRRWNFAQFR